MIMQEKIKLDNAQIGLPRVRQCLADTCFHIWTRKLPKSADPAETAEMQTPFAKLQSKGYTITAARS